MGIPLKRIFMIYSSSKSNDPRYASNTKLTYREWRYMMKDTGMEETFKDIEGETFTEISVRLCFNQSQMFVVNPLKTPKHTYMTFEDFLEGVGRVAEMAAVDTDKRPLMLKLHET